MSANEIEGAGREEVGAVGPTPGPWVWECVPLPGISARAVCWGLSSKAHHRWVVRHQAETWNPTEADKALIAAAPDLLAACEAMVAFLYPSSFREYADMKAAIRKARGLPNDPTPTNSASASVEDGYRQPMSLVLLAQLDSEVCDGDVNTLRRLVGRVREEVIAEAHVARLRAVTPSAPDTRKQ